MKELLAAFHWRDAVDILLVTLVIYRVLVLFHRTRTMQIVTGLGALAAISAVAHQFELLAVSWMLDTFWSLWAVALVVIFQPELRRGLARIGQGRLWLSLFGARFDHAQLVIELVKAAQILAARRIGALIVIERGGGLRQYAELGVPLDAQVSADLLEAIFLPASPMHDGAVVVQGGRATAAACFLPLSRAPQTARALGTRHRAALGITEETDAVAIAVSEETGRVSLAVDGGIEVVPDPAALRRRLEELLEGRPADTSAPEPAGARLKLGA